MSMRESKFAALMGMSQNRSTTHCKAVKRSKTAGNSQFWRTYSARAYMMVSLSYTSRMEVRQDHRTGNK